MYHHFVKTGEKTIGTTITDEAFEEQMVYLKSNGYNAVTDNDMIDFYYNGKELPQNSIHITIDDGYRSNYEIAYPILKENNMKATIFTVVSRTEGEYKPTSLTWEQMKEMSDSGIINIQSHTYDLHHKEIVNSIEKSAMIAKESPGYQSKLPYYIILIKLINNFKTVVLD